MSNLSVIRALAVVFVCCAFACGEPPKRSESDKELDAILELIPRAFPKEPSPLEGTWKVIRVERDGAPLAKADWGMSDELTFERDVVVGIQPSIGKADDSFVTIDLKSKPMCVARWLTREKDRSYTDLMVLGVAAVRDGKLYWCEGPVRRAAKDFKTAPGDERTLIVAERVK